MLPYNPHSTCPYAQHHSVSALIPHHSLMETYFDEKKATPFSNQVITHTRPAADDVS